LTLALLLAALLAVACVVAVALPFLIDPEPESDTLDDLKAPEKRRFELLEARDRALAALKELEFEHRTGTISDDDYRTLVGPLRREAAVALQALQAFDRGDRAVETDGNAELGEGRPTRERTS
jgi:hypothetical protein